jgi:hypothetical protein
MVRGGLLLSTLENVNMSEQDPTVTARAGKQANAQGPNKSNSTDTVTVGCKLPHGLMLKLTKHGEGSRQYRVRGSNASNIVGGFGITEGVPRDFWDEWVKHHAAISIVKQGLIFALGDKASVQDKAKEYASLANGLEALDPNKTPEGIKTLEKDPV